ncbi:FAD-binding oxidoreductase [Rathayibacter soli]|uniref:FAD-binding oxidoreductase n=1 Tax=Rathayibacter soli TaxID=3144168 RepID=UPI0027E5483C|nr:FAD-binding oxidoreductase [Glaciibacter superstes]
MTNSTALSPASIASLPIATLRTAVAGPVFVRGDDGLASEIAAFNTAITHDPDVVVGVASEADVAHAVRFAATHGLPVHIHATGHGASAPFEGGMVISTSRLDTVLVDQKKRLAAIGAGVRWKPVIEAAAPFGLAPITGSSVTVGAVGYTLGGGLGPLARSHGFTSDWVRAFRVVTAAGDIVIADATTNPDLFWALRGGKGGLGVVTQMTLELVPLPDLYAGSLIFDGAENIEAALRVWTEWLTDAPANVTTSVALLKMPELEFIPAPLRGRDLLGLRFAFPGVAAEGERLIAPLRDAAPVYIDNVDAMAPRDVGMIHNDPEEGGPGWEYAATLSGIDQELVTDLLEHLGPDSNSPFLSAELRQLGGRTTVDADVPSAVGGRGGGLLLSLIALDPSRFAAAPEVAASFTSAVAPWLAEVTNVNFRGDTSEPDVFASSWPVEIHDRLRAVRSEYDPNGVFAFGPASPAE